MLVNDGYSQFTNNYNIIDNDNLDSNGNTDYQEND